MVYAGEVCIQLPAMSCLMNRNAFRHVAQTLSFPVVYTHLCNLIIFLT